MKIALRVLGVALACLATWGLVALSDGSWQVEASDDARVRLSWRSVGERIEECRAPTEEELATLPVHMRRHEICEGRLAPFVLRVELDGERLLETEIRGAGARGDRPTYVFHDLPVRPGRHRLRVRFSVVGASAEGQPRPPLLLDAEIEPGPREIVLITLRETDGEAPGRLVVASADDRRGS